MNWDDVSDNEINQCAVIDDLDVWSQTHKGFKLLHLNIRSLAKHWDELQVVLKNQLGSIDILLLSEIAVKQVDATVYLEGYDSYWRPRKAKGGGGLL